MSELEILPADLQAAVDEVRSTPQMRAKMVRAAFAARGWPNASHPGTVRDFLIEHKIPIIDVPRGFDSGEAAAWTQKRLQDLRK